MTDLADLVENEDTLPLGLSDWFHDPQRVAILAVLVFEERVIARKVESHWVKIKSNRSAIFQKLGKFLSFGRNFVVLFRDLGLAFLIHLPFVLFEVFDHMILSGYLVPKSQQNQS